MLDSLFNKVAGPSATLLKRDSNTGVFCETLKIFKNTFFYRISPVVASVCDEIWR